MLSSVRRDLNAFDEFFNILHLCFVFENGFEFDVPGVGHIQRGVGLAGERAPHFFWHVRLKAFREQFREVGNVASGGEDCIQHDLSAVAVVGVVDAVVGE